MFWILTRLREIRIGVFNAGILISMSELLFHSDVAIVLVLLVVNSPFTAIWIVF
jgi:hypothetical protein